MNDGRQGRDEGRAVDLAVVAHPEKRTIMVRHAFWVLPLALPLHGA